MMVNCVIIKTPDSKRGGQPVSTKDSGHNMGPSAIPENFQKCWILKFVTGIAKSTATHTHVNRSLIGSRRSNQVVTHPL